MAGELSRRLELKTLNNTRDLGGMRGCGGGKIIPGRLIRSGQLFPASAEDLTALGKAVGTVVDFRTEQEIRERPDPEVPGAEYIHMEAFPSIAAGITREESADAMLFRAIREEPARARDHMISIYTDFITGDYCLSCYRSFLDLLLKEREKAVLWHCTAGKDRTGFAAVLLQEILGVDRDDIFEDYLRSNEYLKEEVAGLIAFIKAKADGFGEKTEESLGYMFGAREEYLKALYGKAEELYGSFEGFMRSALNVTEEEKERLRLLYLE